MSGPTWRCRSCGLPAAWPKRECSLCEQGSLFDAPRAGDYRESDPVTSKRAAGANVVARQTQRKQILARMLTAGRVSSHEVSDLTGGQHGRASKRLGELRDDGLIVECGTIKPEKGQARTLYRLTDDGMRDAQLIARGAA